MSYGLNIQDEGFEQELLALPTPLAFIDFEAFMPTNYVVPGTTITSTIPCQWSCHTLQHHGLDWQGQLEHSEFLWTGDKTWSPTYAFAQTLYEATRDAATILIYTGYEIRCLDSCIKVAQTDMEMYRNGELPEDYLVVDGNGDKIPLMDIAPYIEGWCEDMKARFYDMCYGWNNNGGVKYWLQSPDFANSNSIKHIEPAAMTEYSGSVELLLSEGEPENGYAGLRERGWIAKGDECTNAYMTALNRDPRPGVPRDEPGHAYFDEDIIDQCLIYCRLDTLSMVIIYLAVLEATERWRKGAEVAYAEYALISGDDGFVHALEMDGDTHTFHKICQPNAEYPWDVELELYSEDELQNLPIREYYSLICPDCRRLRNDVIKNPPEPWF